MISFWVVFGRYRTIVTTGWAKCTPALFECCGRRLNLFRLCEALTVSRSTDSISRLNFPYSSLECWANVCAEFDDFVISARTSRAKESFGTQPANRAKSETAGRDRTLRGAIRAFGDESRCPWCGGLYGRNENRETLCCSGYGLNRGSFSDDMENAPGVESAVSMGDVAAMGIAYLLRGRTREGGYLSRRGLSCSHDRLRNVVTLVLSSTALLSSSASPSFWSLLPYGEATAPVDGESEFCPAKGCGSENTGRRQTVSSWRCSICPMISQRRTMERVLSSIYDQAGLPGTGKYNTTRMMHLFRFGQAMALETSTMSQGRLPSKTIGSRIIERSGSTQCQ